MIQIQDDNFNQSAAAPMPAAPAPSSPASTPASAPAMKSPLNNGAQIDELLNELDRLSKDLEEKPAKPVVAESTTNSQSEDSQPVTQSTPQSDEKFDFDAFLSDLEKKIDQESNKDSGEVKSQEKIDLPDSGDPAQIDADLGLNSETPDFRKNRVVADHQTQDDKPDEKIKEPEVSSVPDLGANPEELKAQNIFEMLGLANISDEEKNQFLDDLESMIWDDFVTHDLELLLTSEEYAGARQILDDQSKEEAQRKEDLIAYLEKLVPDLDEVLYDKALELKSEMMGERLAKMKEAADEAVLARIKEAESLISQNRWKSAVSLLNTVT